MTQNNRIIIFDTTLRDGEQTPGVNLNLSEKLEIARHLESLGVDVIEAGFPAASPGDFEAVRAVSQNVNCSVAALCRCVPDDIHKGWEAVKYSKNPRLHVFLATSDIHMKYKLRMEPDEVLRRAVEGVRLAKSFCDNVEFSCEDASRSRPEFLYRVLEAVIEAGATTVNIPDTVGYATPPEFGRLIQSIFENVPNISKAVVSVHCHNDLGMAVANTLSAIENGARQIETTINGLGERAGNCSMEEAVMALTVRSSYYGMEHGIDTTKIYRTSQRVSKFTGVPVAINKAIVGANAFAHESGIHQHGVLANPMTYEIMTPQSVGKTDSTLVLGKLSGRHAFAEKLSSMGYNLSKEEIDDAFARFKVLADRKKTITDQDLEVLITQKVAEVPEFYRLETFQIQSGNKMHAMASVTLVYNDQEFTQAATGDGPIDAAYNAAAQIVGGEWHLTAYDIKAVTEGVDALGEVIVRVNREGKTFTGRGVSTDIIEASILAYVNAINRALAHVERVRV
ncbi:MAG TPA: 2-isopropylmalate synthase [Clostridiales bacterium]|nr:2-isopropylmalate synthase [Clostridiales bacterium]